MANMKTTQSITGIKYGIVFMLSVFLLGGCAGTGALQTTIPITIKLANYKTMLLDVSSQVPESTQEVVQLESMTIAKIREKNLFEKVVSGSASPDALVDLRLNLKIVELSKVSPGARIMLGTFAGRAGVVVDAELIDLKTGKTIGSFKAEGKSSGGTIFAGTTPQAIESAVEQIVDFVQKSM